MKVHIFLLIMTSLVLHAQSAQILNDSIAALYKSDSLPSMIYGEWYYAEYCGAYPFEELPQKPTVVKRIISRDSTYPLNDSAGIAGVCNVLYEIIPPVVISDYDSNGAASGKYKPMCHISNHNVTIRNLSTYFKDGYHINLISDSSMIVDEKYRYRKISQLQPNPFAGKLPVDSLLPETFRLNEKTERDSVDQMIRGEWEYFDSYQGTNPYQQVTAPLYRKRNYSLSDNPKDLNESRARWPLKEISSDSAGVKDTLLLRSVSKSPNGFRLVMLKVSTNKYSFCTISRMSNEYMLIEEKYLYRKVR